MANRLPKLIILLFCTLSIIEFLNLAYLLCVIQSYLLKLKFFKIIISILNAVCAEPIKAKSVDKTSHNYYNLFYDKRIGIHPKTVDTISLSCIY